METTIEAFVKDLEELLELEDVELNATTVLLELDEWDSLGRISFIAWADEQFEVTVNAKALNACEKVQDLYQLVSA